MKKSIAEIHDELYMHLRTNYPDVRFGVGGDITREPFCEGYWFRGEESIVLPFWGRKTEQDEPTYEIIWGVGRIAGDEGKEIESIMFLLNLRNQETNDYFKKLALFLETKLNIKLNDNNKDNLALHLKKIDNDYTKSLDLFLKEVKPLIDVYISENPFTQVIDGELVTDNFEINEQRFYENIAIIEIYRKELSDFKKYKNEYKELLYALKNVFIKEYRGIKNIILAQIPFNTQWIFITGQNGFGKTSLLKAISLGLSQQEDGTEFNYKIHTQFLGYDKSLTEKRLHSNVANKFIHKIIKDIDEISINADSPKEHITKLESLKQNTKQFTPDSDTIPPLVTYGTTRNIGNEDDAAKINPTDPLFKQNVPLYSIERELKDTEARIPERYKVLREALLYVIPNLHDVRVEVIDNSVRVVYIEKNDEGVPYYDTPLTLAELGDGMRGIISMVGDMVIRLEKQNPKGTALHDLEGFVLIDEIDANLHPKYQYEFPALLSKLLPKVQFIAITHSPIPLLGAPRGRTAVVTVNRDVENGITAKLWDGAEIHKLSPNALLTSPIFGVEKLYGRGVTADEMESADHYTEIMDEETMIKNIAAMREQGLL